MKPGCYLVKANYKRVKSVSGWHCANCNYSPGGSLGPCHRFCGNCQEPLYTKDENKAVCEIEVRMYRLEDGRLFEILRQMEVA